MLQCVEQLIKREKIMQEDVKADRGLFQSCKSLMEETGCLPEENNKHTIHSMSETLTCLIDAEAEAESERKELFTLIYYVL